MKKRNYLLSILVLLVVCISSTFGALSAGAIDIIDTEDPNNVQTIYIMHTGNTTIEIPQESYLHTDAAIEPEVTVKYNLYSGEIRTLTEGKDYTVEYQDNVEVGTATIVVVGTQVWDENNNMYAGKIKKTFNITHDYIDTVVEPTSSEDGYTFHECKLCGYTCKDNYTTLESPALAQNSFTLGGQIGANYDYNIPEAYIKSDYDIKVTAVSDKETITVDLDKDNTVIDSAGKTAYRFTIPVASCNMTEEYQTKLTVTNSKGEVLAETPERTLTISSYFSAYRFKPASKEKTLISALQTYGYYSQESFNAEAPKPVVAPNDVSSVKLSNVITSKPTVTTYDSDNKLTIQKYSLLLESETTIRFYVSDLDNINILYLYMVYTSNGVTEKTRIKYSKEEKAYYADIPNIGAGKLSNMYEVHFEVNGKQVSDSVTYGAYSFIYSSLNSNDENTINLAKSLYKYSVAAKDYLGEE